MHLKALIHALTPVAVHIYFLRTTVCSPAIQYITCEAVIIKNASSGENSQEDDYIVVPLLFTQLSKSSGIFCRLCCASFRYNRRFLSVSSLFTGSILLLQSHVPLTLGHPLSACVGFLCESAIKVLSFSSLLSHTFLE